MDKKLSFLFLTTLKVFTMKVLICAKVYVRGVKIKQITVFQPNLNKMCIIWWQRRLSNQSKELPSQLSLARTFENSLHLHILIGKLQTNSLCLVNDA